MKEKLAILIIMIILAFFVGFLFLRGNYVINGKNANNFKLIAFENSSNVITEKDLSALNAFVDIKRSGIENVEIEFYINDEVIDKTELGLSGSADSIEPTEKVLSELTKEPGNFRYKIKIIWDKKNSDQIEKMITIKQN